MFSALIQAGIAVHRRRSLKALEACIPPQSRPSARNTRCAAEGDGQGQQDGASTVTD
jgi:hypothetical protein